VTIIGGCLHICPPSILLDFKKSFNFDLLGLASDLPIQRGVNRGDDNPFVEVPDDSEARGELGEEDQDFLKCLEKMVKEVESEPEKPKQGRPRRKNSLAYRQR
jgi:hypothetical protein